MLSAQAPGPFEFFQMNNVIVHTVRVQGICSTVQYIVFTVIDSLAETHFKNTGEAQPGL